MKQQTAVEWLLQRFENGDMYNVEDAQFIKHQALAMEKEQLEEAKSEGYEFATQEAIKEIHKTYKPI
jgi:hypothetical protein